MIYAGNMRVEHSAFWRWREMMNEVRCETCRFWRGDADVPDERWERYAEDRPTFFPPHANLQWGHCEAAPEGFEQENDRPDLKMAVWDGSSYSASLLTRKDHFCGEFRPKGDGGEVMMDEIERLRSAAHDAPLNKMFTDHKGHRFLGTHSTAWARAGREWSNAVAKGQRIDGQEAKE
jgi:hypothetical protein